MIQFFSKRINGKKGFTLVELLVVIAILGLLALIAIPRLGAYRKDAAEAANKASAASIYNGAQAYLAKHTTLVGFNWEDYTTGAMPSDAVVSAVTEDGNGGISPVTVSSNGGLWIGIFPEGGSTGPVTPTTPTVLLTTPATAAVGDLLVHVAWQRSFGTEANLNPTLAGWDRRVLSSYKTASHTNDRRAVVVFTRIKDGTTADNPGTISWGDSSTAGSVTYAFTGAGTYTYTGNGTGNNGGTANMSITISGSAAQGQLVFAAAGYRETAGTISFSQLGASTPFSGGSMTGAMAWAQTGAGGITNPVATTTNNVYGVGAMIVFTVAE